MNVKYIFTATILIFSLFNVHAQYDSIRHNNRIRTYLLHLPSGYSQGDPLPLVVAMHGGFGNAYNMEQQSQLSKNADAENFIVVYPEGIKGGLLNIRTWNAGECCGYASRNNIDDVGFIGALLDTLAGHFSVDTSRIYATGMSNGGFMAYRLACELSHRIAAIAPVAASMNLDECWPERAVPIIAFHSFRDENVPYNGGAGSGFSDHYNFSQESVMQEWSVRNGCHSEKDIIIDDERFTFVKWTNCGCNTEIHHYTTKDGGHSWPGGTQTVLGDLPSEYIDANSLMWKFFQQYSLECGSLTTSGLPEKGNSDFRIYPNPSRGMVYIENKTSKTYSLAVFDPTGKRVVKTENRNSIDLSDHPPGTYIFVISPEGKIKTVKTIILTDNASD